MSIFQSLHTKDIGDKTINDPISSKVSEPDLESMIDVLTFCNQL